MGVFVLEFLISMKSTENLRDKKTKIIATLGPASESPDVFAQMVNGGLSIVRNNMSHGTHDEHASRIMMVRKFSTEHHKRIGILVDLAGPKIRIGDVENNAIELIEGSKITLTTKAIIGNAKVLSINYPKLPSEVRKGSQILIEDGKKRLEVISTNNTDEILCRVLVGGQLSSKKGLNIPGAYLSIPALTDKDRRDVLFAIEHNADFIALSFVRTPDDITALRKILKKQKSNALIIAKIETLEAIEQLSEIITTSDGVMVARGDLAVEIGPEHVPLVQKKIIEIARNLGKPVITATQMLDSMEQSPVPTRAEVSDIANAIFDGTDAVMLSGETSIGKYPVQSIQVMSRVARDIEPAREILDINNITTLPDAITETMILLSMHTKPNAFVVLTETGSTARLLSRFRPSARIIAVSPHDHVCNQLTLSYGITSARHTFSSTKLEIVESEIIQLLKSKFGMRTGQQVVLSAGFPVGVPGNTNTVMVMRIT